MPSGPFAGAGVWGRKKLNSPSAKLAMAAICIGSAVASALRTVPTSSPAQIQPMVPKTRMTGKSFSVWAMLRMASVLVRPSVGI